MKIESSLRTLVARNDFPTGVEINISNSNKLVGKFNKSINDAKIKEWLASM